MVADEIKYKQREEDFEKRHRLWKDRISFLVKEVAAYLLGFLVIAFLTCYSFWILIHPALPKEDRQFATMILASVGSAISGMVFGKSLK